MKEKETHAHTHTQSLSHDTLLGYTGTKLSTWAEPSVTGRPHAAVKANSREHHPRYTTSNNSELLTNLQSHYGGCFKTREHI